MTNLASLSYVLSASFINAECYPIVLIVSEREGESFFISCGEVVLGEKRLKAKAVAHSSGTIYAHIYTNEGAHPQSLAVEDHPFSGKHFFCFFHVCFFEVFFFLLYSFRK